MEEVDAADRPEHAGRYAIEAKVAAGIRRGRSFRGAASGSSHLHQDDTDTGQRSAVSCNDAARYRGGIPGTLFLLGWAARLVTGARGTGEGSGEKGESCDRT